jgi:hypothetical protein
MNLRQAMLQLQDTIAELERNRPEFWWVEPKSENSISRELKVIPDWRGENLVLSFKGAHSVAYNIPDIPLEALVALAEWILTTDKR